MSLSAEAGKRAVGFERLSLEQGLSQNSVACIHQDKDGFLWFCTGGGLNRYDGYEFKVFHHDPANPASISDNVVNTIFEDQQGAMWVGTLGGLNRYDPVTQSFTSYRHDISDPYSLSSNAVMAIAPDGEQGLWIGTNSGLNRFNKASGKVSRIMRSPEQSNSLNSNKIRALLVDDDGILWVGTQDGGLNRYDSNSGRFEHFTHDPQRPDSLAHNNVVSLLKDSHGHFWVGTFGGGLDRFDTQLGCFEHYQYDPNNGKSLSHNKVRTIFEDLRGRLWVGTFDGGLNRFNRKAQNFTRFEHDSADPLSLSNDRVWSIMEDNTGVIWVGTFGGGLNKYDTKRARFGHVRYQPSGANSLNSAKVTAFYQQSPLLWVGTDGGGLNIWDNSIGQYRYFLHDPNQPQTISRGRINAIFKDDRGHYWIGTNYGLDRFDLATGRFEHFQVEAKGARSISHNNVKAIYQDSRGRLWFGTLGGGLNLFDFDSETFQHYRHDKAQTGSLSNDFVNVIFEDSDSQLWVGTFGGGLNRLIEQSGEFVHYKADESQHNSLSHNAVSSMLQGDDGALWIGTYGGLNRFKDGQFSHFRQQDGLPSDTIYGLLQDRAGAIWLSTDQGLSRFLPTSKSFQNYGAQDGAQSNAFSLGAYYQSESGELFFGGINGFNRFYGERIIDEHRSPQVVLTDFLLFNQSVPIQSKAHPRDEGERFILSGAINTLDELILSYNESFISFQFASMDFSFPMSNRYAYQLVGWDKDWIYTDARNRRATYTNIPAGEYVLKLKAGNKDGFWDENVRTLKVTVLPRPWETWWAYTLYGVVCLALVVLFMSVYSERKKRMAEHAVNQQLKQIDRMKDEFLANTSHELRTPLNGIIGLAESLIDGATGPLPEKTIGNLAMVVASGKRLANLVNDILDFSKLKERSIELHTKPTDIRAMIEVVLTLSKPLVGDKPLSLNNHVPDHLPAVEADEDRLQQILHNLVGNAIKYTPSGSVNVSVEQQDKMLKVMVSDTGIGISKAQFSHIFESFEQAQGDTERSYSGTGLGLAVSKQLVELHGGTISVDSRPQQGSTFSFTLPISAGVAGANDSLGRSLVRLHHLDHHHLDKIQTISSCSSDGRFRILIVDDEAINRQVLHNHLALKDYQLIEASNGVEALNVMAQTDGVDLILLDIMMPGMSGYEVCKQLRKTYPVNDLPIIFLTAKNQLADLVQSFAVGANDYLSKPVTKHELLTRVETHLKLLDINRNLENRVAERTADLEQKRQEVEQKNAEILATQQQLIQSEKMASLGTLTAGVAHEINNPTNFVHVSVQNLQVDLASFEQFIFELAGEDADQEILQSFRERFTPLYDHLATIKDGTERIKVIVQDLRAFTQLDVIDKKAVDISQCLLSTVHLVQTKYLETAEFITDFSPAPPLLCYAAQLNQVFMNLIVNACDAIKQKQRQRNCTQPGRIDIKCYGDEQQIVIEVTDNGCGMDKTTQSKLFEPFFTTKSVGEGTGLGMSISYGIVKKHGGKFKVTSQPGVGSSFTLILPQPKS